RSIKLCMFTGDAFIPVSPRLPFLSAIAGGTEYVAFTGQDEIWMDWEPKIDQARLEQIDGSTGINRPDNAIRLELSDIFHAIPIQPRIARVGDKRSIEICTDKANLGGHRAAIKPMSREYPNTQHKYPT